MTRRALLSGICLPVAAQITGNVTISGAVTFGAWPADPTSQDSAIVIGQSLAAGGGANPAISTSQPYTNIMFSGGVYYPTDLTSYVPLVEGGSNESPASGFANQVAAFQRTAIPGSAARDLLMHNWAIGGSGYAVLKKNGSSGAYADSIAAISYSSGHLPSGKSAVKVLAAICVHGEADAGDGGYAGYLAEWQSDYESDIQAATGQTDAVPMFISQFTEYGYAGDMYEAYIANPDKIVLVGPKYFLAHSDSLHLTAESSRVLGEYYAKAYWQHVVQGVQWHPLRPTTISRSGAIITVTYNHGRIGNLVLDTTTVANRADGNYGFAYTETDAVIQSVELEDAANGIVRITLTGTPTANGRLYYAYAGTSGEGPVTGSRGCLRDSDPAVSLSGYPLYNWAANWRMVGI